MAARRFFDGAQLELGLLPLELYSITSNNSAYICGHESATDAQLAYIEGAVGSTPLTDNQSAYTRGHEPISSNKDAYIRGLITATDSQDAYIRGLSTTSDSEDAYVRGHTSITSNNSAYIRGLIATTDSNDAYVRGYASSISSASAYIRGLELATDFNAAYIRGHESVTSSESAYVRGLESIADSNAAYIRGLISLTSNQSAYIRGLSSITDATDLYVLGHGSISDSVDAYVRGLLSATSFTDLYVRGHTAASDANDAYVRGYESSTSSQSLYTAGASGSTPIDSFIDLYIRGHETSTSTVNSYTYGHGSISTSKLLHIRGVPTTPITLASKWAYILSWSDRIYATQSLYVEAPENFLSSRKRACVVVAPAYNISATTNAYLVGESRDSALFDMMIGTPDDGTDHTSWETIVLLDGNGISVEILQGIIGIPTEANLIKTVDIPTVDFPLNEVSVQDAWVTTYNEVTSTKNCFVNAGFIGGFEQGYKRCMVISDTPSADHYTMCYIEGEQFITANTSAYVVGGSAKSITGTKHLYMNAQRDSVDSSIEAFTSGHNYLSSVKRCYVPTVNFSQNRKQVYIAGS